jgi:hypothetical protein
MTEAAAVAAVAVAAVPGRVTFKQHACMLAITATHIDNSNEKPYRLSMSSRQTKSCPLLDKPSGSHLGGHSALIPR